MRNPLSSIATIASGYLGPCAIGIYAGWQYGLIAFAGVALWSVSLDGLIRYQRQPADLNNWSLAATLAHTAFNFVFAPILLAENLDVWFSGKRNRQANRDKADAQLAFRLDPRRLSRRRQEVR